MSLEIKTGFNELKITPELGAMAGSTRCCASGTCNNVGQTLDAALEAAPTANKASATLKAMSI